MRLSLSIASTLLVTAGLAAAQPADPAAPAPAPAPAPVEPAPPAPPTPPSPPVAPVAPVVEPAKEVPAAPLVEAPPPPPAHETSIRATYDGGVKLESSDDSYALKLMFRSQFRFESVRPFDTVSSFTPGATYANEQFQSKFYVPRTRLQAEGHVFGRSNRFKVEVGLDDSGSFSYVRDVFIEKRLAKKAYLRMGQWKRPFNRTQFVSDFASIFNERSIEDELAGGGRDMGIGLHNDYEKTPEGIDWFVGMFNGFSGGADRPSIASSCTTDPVTLKVTCMNGRASNIPRDFGPTLVFRADWNSHEMKGLSEGDLEGGPLRYSVGAAYKVDLANFTDGKEASWGDNLSHGLEVDTMIKAHGFSLDAGVVFMKLKTKDWEHCMFLQPGYMVVPKRVLVAGRFAAITEGEQKQLEVRAALDYFFHGHTWKVAGDIGFLQLSENEATMTTDEPDLQMRVMAQLSI